MQLDTCPICEEYYYGSGSHNKGEWIECKCKQLLHEDCIEYDFNEPDICPSCAFLQNIKAHCDIATLFILTYTRYDIINSDTS